MPVLEGFEEEGYEERGEDGGEDAGGSWGMKKDKRMENILKELVAFTKGCREDMHEPDEQGVGVSAVVGNHLDNAFGNDIEPFLMEHNSQEYVVIMENENMDKQLKVNLADLIALARKAKL